MGSPPAPTVETDFALFFFNDTATTEIYTLSLHDALPISVSARQASGAGDVSWRRAASTSVRSSRSEEHTSELQSRQYLVCRLLLEKKKTPSSHAYESSKGTSFNVSLSFVSDP